MAALKSLLTIAVFVMSLGLAAASKKILVFGGNGLLGSATVDQLLTNADHEVTIANRGNWYWDSQTRILPRVSHVKCDRSHENPREACSDLIDLIQATSHFDAVYDFSAFGPNETESALSMLKGKFGVYVLISTDSIYDVCETERGAPATEDEDNRPSDEIERAQLAQHHAYGHNKLAAEEILKNHGVPHVIFRLPDVLGPRDTTHRFWIYQLWIKLQPYFEEHPVKVPYFLHDYALSFVYVDDVAKVLTEILSHDNEAVMNQAFNLAWPKSITLEKLIRTIQAEIDSTKKTGPAIDDKGTTSYFYPSVRRGPISTEKAEQTLDWKPTPFETAIRESVAFYERAMKDEKFVKQRNEIIQIVHAQLFYNDSMKFYEKLEELYDIDLREFMLVKDEL
ncbi:hypothetical protein CAPTEDRAFT_164581 [Capitella teleta]|uniref:NAD-dependent epimerase/dehydratase domain-containing protein n=1 Tax=Capitella teleta TaxID=283909 RepID=R7V7Y4_CAPTE|nr:hypothetical protein CAPTEDRAFT_164581 [Capitella teleta]|eukprot:ELU14644.1 hypothetical protein CAPTEDRAFT_164581 [Capitella teleta]